MHSIIAIVGPTGSGKSTVVSAMAETNPLVYPIQIGRELRSRHPEETFDGVGACERMREEKWRIWDALISKAPKDAIVVVDGMPRAPAEMDEYVKRNIVLDTVVMLDAPLEVRRQRVAKRKGGSSKAYENLLFESRSLADYTMSYQGLAAYMAAIGNDYFIELLGFSTHSTSPEDVARSILNTILAAPRM